jgi:hypothetical protein
MSPAPRTPALPYVLLGAMTLISFGGPFVILVVVRGGPRANWPPDRPVEWITIAVVSWLFIALFVSCVSIGWWYAPSRGMKQKPDVASSRRPRE